MEGKLPIGYEALSLLAVRDLLSKPVETRLDPAEAAGRLADEGCRVFLRAIGDGIGAEVTDEQIERAVSAAAQAARGTATSQAGEEPWFGEVLRFAAEGPWPAEHPFVRQWRLLPVGSPPDREATLDRLAGFPGLRAEMRAEGFLQTGGADWAIYLEDRRARRDLRMLALARLLPAEAGRTVTADEAVERLGDAELAVLSLTLVSALGLAVPSECLERVKCDAWGTAGRVALDDPFCEGEPRLFRSEGGALGESWTMRLAEHGDTHRAILEPVGWPQHLPLFAAEAFLDPRRIPITTGSWERFYLVTRD